jgi:hypothetical protein
VPYSGSARSSSLRSSTFKGEGEVKDWTLSPEGDVNEWSRTPEGEAKEGEAK